MKYTYDSLGRVSTRVVENGTDAGKLTSTYTYAAGGYGTGSTTPLVKKIDQAHIPFEYEYDSRGNIISEKRGDLTTTYVYDALGQLIRVNDPHENATWVYNYDHGGNITSKVKYAYTTGTLGTAQETIPYVYGDSNWKDKLTSYNAQTITYDAIGNPLNDGTWTYDWQAGRQLKQMSKPGTTVQFKYDHNGLRVGKAVNGAETKYVLHGKLITHMTCGSDTLHFFYDAQSRPAKVSFNSVLYTYVHNLQGDIVGILDSAGTLVVEYKYDAWGKLLSTTGNMADTLGKRNPFRYRGYVYDEESGLYYLRSRYHSPEFGRFVNADTQLGWHALFGTNLYLYCLNDPALFSDSDGYEPEVAPSPSRPDDWYEQFEQKYYFTSAGMYYYGEPNTYRAWKTPKGEWYERWYDSDGTPRMDRHWTDHGNPKEHPYVPHDEDWKDNGKGGKTLDKKSSRPSPPDAKMPTEETDSSKISVSIRVPVKASDVGKAIGYALTICAFIFSLGRSPVPTYA